MNFSEFTRQRWGPNWALCRKTSSNLSRYARCISKKEHRMAEIAYRKEHTADSLRDRLYQHPNINLTAELFEALEKLVAADNCNYEVQTMRNAGYFDIARTAVAKAHGK